MVDLITHYEDNCVYTTHVVQWLNGLFATQDRKQESPPCRWAGKSPTDVACYHTATRCNTLQHAACCLQHTPNTIPQNKSPTHEDLVRKFWNSQTSGGLVILISGDTLLHNKSPKHPCLSKFWNLAFVVLWVVSWYWYLAMFHARGRPRRLCQSRALTHAQDCNMLRVPRWGHVTFSLTSFLTLSSLCVTICVTRSLCIAICVTRIVLHFMSQSLSPRSVTHDSLCRNLSRCLSFCVTICVTHSLCVTICVTRIVLLAVSQSLSLKSPHFFVIWSLTTLCVTICVTPWKDAKDVIFILC